MGRCEQEQISAVNLELFKRKGLIVQFMTKMYKDSYANSATKSIRHFYSEYVYSGKGGCNEQHNITLAPTSSIIVIGYNKTDKTTDRLFLNSVHRNMLIRGLMGSSMNTIGNLLETKALLYTRDPKEFISEYGSCRVIIPLGEKQQIDISFIERDSADLGVRVKFGNFIADITVMDFALLLNSLIEINFSMLTMSMLNYIGRPNLGLNRVNQSDEFYIDDTEVLTCYASFNKPSISGLDELPRKSTGSNTKRQSGFF